MKIKLYKPFEHWYHGGTIWLISDTHFEDPDCLLMSDHWPTPEEQVKIINKFVGKNDTLIHLGDVGNPEWIKKIKGYKVLLLGNHDKGKSNYEKLYLSELDGKFLCQSTNKKDIEEFNEYYFWDYNKKPYIIDNGLFDEVYEGPLFINEKISLSHEPLRLRFGINIHGHEHGYGKYAGSTASYFGDDNGYTCASINITSNLREFKPLRLDDLVNIKTVDLHRITINRATENARNK